MNVTNWLLDSDPAIRWQVMHDLLDASPEEVEAERARVATEGWGARLLALQRADGHWGDGDLFGDDFRGATPTLRMLADLGIDPSSPEAQRAVGLVRDNVHWEYWGDLPYFHGEVEPCINGGILRLGAYFGELGAGSDRLVERLLGEQMHDGGWNCEAENGATVGSFHTTICVLEGFAAYERAVGSNATVRDARLRGQEYLLERRLFRSLRTGDVVDPRFLVFSFPLQWFYEISRALDYLRSVSTAPDPRCAEAIEVLASKRGDDGRWLLDWQMPGEHHFAFETVGEPSRWVTLRALRVLKWAGVD